MFGWWKLLQIHVFEMSSDSQSSTFWTSFFKLIKTTGINVLIQIQALIIKALKLTLNYLLHITISFMKLNFYLIVKILTTLYNDI